MSYGLQYSFDEQKHFINLLDFLDVNVNKNSILFIICPDADMVYKLLKDKNQFEYSE